MLAIYDNLESCYQVSQDGWQRISILGFRFKARSFLSVCFVYESMRGSKERSRCEEKKQRKRAA